MATAQRTPRGPVDPSVASEVRANLIVVERNGSLAEPSRVMNDRQAETYLETFNRTAYLDGIRARAIPVSFKVDVTLYCVLIKRKGKPDEVARDYLEHECAKRFADSYNRSSGKKLAYVKPMRIIGLGKFLG